MSGLPHLPGVPHLRIKRRLVYKEPIEELTILTQRQNIIERASFSTRKFTFRAVSLLKDIIKILPALKKIKISSFVVSLLMPA